MKKLLIITMAVLLVASLTYAEGGKRHELNSSHFWGKNCIMDNIEIEFDDGNLYLENSHRDEPIVEITSDYELYINNEHIKTDEHQKKLLGKFYDRMFELTELSKEIGIEGAKIGAKGAKLGVNAIASLFKLLDDDYDTDDYEREIEKEAAKIEKQAEKLEKQADKLEDIADDLEYIYDGLEDEIAELGELRW